MSLIVTDRTRIETDWICQRKRYWLTEYGGRGIVPAVPPLPLLFGIIIHHGMQHIQDEPWTRVQEDLGGELEQLQLHHGGGHLLMAEGLVKAFERRIFPRWLERYEVVLVEGELEFEHGGVVYMTRPDLLLRDKADGTLWYPDFKTFSRWGNRKWYNALQQQLTVKACEQATGEKVRGCWIQGLSKGTRRGDTLYHPLVAAYRRPGDPGITKTAYNVKYRKGFERFTVDGYEDGGLDGWIDWLPDEVIADIFPRTPDIFPSEWMMEEFLEQRTRREKEIISARDLPMPEQLQAFDQTFSQCETDYGACPYANLCWVQAARDEPLSGGDYIWREPHHELERKLLRR